MSLREVLSGSLLAIFQCIFFAVRDSLDEKEDASIQSFFDTVNSCIGQVEGIQNGGGFLSGINAIEDALSKVSLVSSDFGSISELKFLVFLARTIAASSDVDLERPPIIDDGCLLFCWIDDPSFPFQIYASGSPLDPDGIVAYFNFESDLLSSEEYAGVDSSIVICLFRFLIENHDFSGKHIVVFGQESNALNAVSVLKYRAICDGRPVHRSLNCVAPLSPSPSYKLINTSHKFSQFNETLIIMSEVVDRSDVIGRFLGLYHVIENFMIRAPLSRMIDKAGGGFYSIRDFSSLYGRVSSGEKGMIKSFFSDSNYGPCWTMHVDGVPFKEIARVGCSQVTGISGFDTSKCNDFLSRMDLKGVVGYSDFCNIFSGDCETYVSAFYKIRCAIVHNKETEYHLSHFNISRSEAIFIEYVFILPIWKLVTELMAAPGGCVWYKQDSIALYPA